MELGINRCVEQMRDNIAERSNARGTELNGALNACSAGYGMNAGGQPPNAGANSSSSRRAVVLRAGGRVQQVERCA